MTIPFIIIFFILIIWWISKKSHMANASSKQDPVSEKNEIGEEQVFNIQNNFEENLQNTVLPDAIDGKEIYIYKNLMLPWYNKLSSQYRYDDTMIQKLRNDWIDYMNALKDRSTYNFLSLETEDDEKTASYRNDHVIASRRVFVIEEAFANSIGKEAVKKLTKIRKLDFFKNFSRQGDMAPNGFEYDVNDKLRRKK